MPNFSFILFTVFEKENFEYFLKICPLCCPVNKSNQAIWTKVVCSMEDHSINISVKKNSNIPNDLAEIVNFHFSHYKSMETLSFHSNKSSYLTKIKYITVVEGNVLSNYAKCRLHPLWFLRRRFLNIFTKIDPFCRPDNQSNTLIWTKSYET